MNLRFVATESASRNCPKPAPLSCAILRTPAPPAKNLLKAVEALAIQLLRPGWASVEDYLVGMVGVLRQQPTTTSDRSTGSSPQPTPASNSVTYTHNFRGDALLAHGIAVEADGVLAPGAQPDVACHVLQELVGVELAAQALNVGPVLAQRRDARVDRVGDFDEVRRRARAGHVGVPDIGGPRARLGEYPLVGGVPAGVQRGQPDSPVVSVIDRAVLAPGEVEAHPDDDLRLQPAERGRQIAPQRDPVLHQPVLVVEELDLGHAHDRGAAPFFLYPQRGDR